MKRIRVAFTAAVMSLFMGMTALASTEIGLNLDWKYADNSKINTGKATLYTSGAAEKKDITVAVDAGHGTQGGESQKVLSHPDGSAKANGGSTSESAVDAGMTFPDKTTEASVNLAVAKSFAEKLLDDGYDVLMIRDGEDVQLDNVARAVLANNKADCHISIHFDSSSKDKGAYYISVPDAVKGKEPVASYWKKSERLGESLISGLEATGTRIHSGGSKDEDLVQTAYSTIASVSIELGDKATDHSQAACDRFAEGLLLGVNEYYGFA
ncbi:N-acetylmuramoyl-L-alanine amidase family protein [Oribacterium sp. WCC10]|uniref:N-acetylmuramoyl-L-alanine amidase family protein n=1 Tax=Oribacterium sp. WCC10 TaxID=1855343 RepID=UPI0008E84897|nr:N-acetylmuramoyl-L-alanine amidase [Oribacterium sp. WCC10]SFG39635.1 N-acetylmuramoyl-L-alanine amidase [Oribacterium sp. WCC10]